jgi:hypothetical protein
MALLTRVVGHDRLARRIDNAERLVYRSRDLGRAYTNGVLLWLEARRASVASDADDLADAAAQRFANAETFRKDVAGQRSVDELLRECKDAL